jgi:hypothetical protein
LARSLSETEVRIQIRIRIQTLLLKITIFGEKSQIKYFKEINLPFSIGTHFLHFFQDTNEINEEHYLKNFQVKSLVSGSVSKSDKIAQIGTDRNHNLL